MTFDIFPKINIGFGVVVLICFFLPWISIDCASETFTRVSGFQLATGLISVDEIQLEELTSRYGNRLDPDGNDGTLSESKHAKPRFYFLVIVACAAAATFSSYKMLKGLTRLKMFGVLIPGGLGALGTLFFLATDFGIDIPADLTSVIQVTAQPGLYLTVLGFLGITTLSAISLKSFSPPQPTPVPQSQPKPAQSTSAHRKPTHLALEEEVILELDRPREGVEDIMLEKKSTEDELNLPQVYEDPNEPKPAPKAPEAGTKNCPKCGAIAGIYQLKCMKCSSPLKPGNK